jgi:predicted transcriptional regulator of viral defense system
MELPMIYSRRTATDTVLELASQLGVLTPRDLIVRGLNPNQLHRLAERGKLIRSARGVYQAVDPAATENHTLVEAAKLYPRAVVCLLSALRFHDLTTQLPGRVWLTIGVKDWTPTRVGPPVRWIRSSGAALEAGVETHILEGVPVQIYSPAKTVVDCFKFRNKVGLDVAIEALQDYRRSRGKAAEVWEYARICRVSRVIRPYLEAIG